MAAYQCQNDHYKNQSFHILFCTKIPVLYQPHDYDKLFIAIKLMDKNVAIQNKLSLRFNNITGTAHFKFNLHD